jgi:hypothetical protein
MTPCLISDCTCRNIFTYAQGGTVAFTLRVYAQLYNSIFDQISDSTKYLAWWLSKIGLADVQTFLDDLIIRVESSSPYGDIQISTAIDIFPKLEVVRGNLSFSLYSDPKRLYFSWLPGPGLAKLRVTGQTSFGTKSQSYWGLSDLSFLSSLVCPGNQLSGITLPNLRSLTGLEWIVDGNPALTGQNCIFDIGPGNGNPSRLADVSALSQFAGCGANQRPDNSSILPCLNVWCGRLNTWTALCNYIASGDLCS